MDLGFEVECVSFSSIKIRLNCLTEQSKINLLQKSEASLLYIEKILKTLITQKHLALMKDKHLNAFHVTVHIQKPEAENDTCLCILRKEDIVIHFTLIEQRLKGASTFVDAVKSSQLWEEEKKEEWSETRKDVDTLLRLILDGDDRLVCMLEEHLRTTDQMQLLSTIKKDVPEYVMSLRDIKQKRELIEDEIEPKKFIDMLRRIKGGEAILETIMSIEIPRRKRCEEFINFVLKKNANRQFQDELQRQKMEDVITMISRRKITCKSLTSRHYRKALVATLGAIAENIEPFRFKKFLVSPPEFREKDFQKICSNTTRKARVYALMNTIVRGSDMLIERFMDGLGALEYHGLLQLIEENAEKSTHCLRLMKRLEGHVLVVGGIFHINYKTCDCEPESQLNVYLENELPVPSDDTEIVEDQPTGDPLKDDRISEWIMRLPQNAYVDCFEDNLQGGGSVGESCTPCLHKAEEVPSLSHKISDDTLTVSSRAPTKSWCPFPSESPLQSGSPFQSESRFHSPSPFQSESQFHSPSPFQSEYDDVTSPSFPAWQPLIPHRPIKRKWTHSVSDGYTSSMSSPSSSMCSPSAVTLNSPIGFNRIHSMGERKFPFNTSLRRGSTGFSPMPTYVTKSKGGKGDEEYKWKCDKK